MKTISFLDGILANWRGRILFAPANEGGGGGGGDASGDGKGGDNGDGGQGGKSDGGEGGDGKPLLKGDEGGGAGDDANDGKGGDTSELPEAYDFSDSDLAGLSDAHKEAYNAVYKELGLSQEQVGLLLKAEKLIAEELGQSATTDQDALSEGWETASKEDKELGKDWDLTMQRAAHALKAIAGEDDSILKILDQSGLGNHPVILKAFSRLGQLMSNDKFDKGDASEDVVPVETSWYGATTPATKRG